MAMKTYDFAYGRGRKTFTVEEARVLKVVRTEEFPPMEDIRGGVLEAIRHPIGCPSIEEIIKPGDTVAFICNDPTRVANSFDFMREGRGHEDRLRARHPPRHDARGNGRGRGRKRRLPPQDVQQHLHE